MVISFLCGHLCTQTKVHIMALTITLKQQPILENLLVKYLTKCIEPVNN